MKQPGGGTIEEKIDACGKDGLEEKMDVKRIWT